MARVALDGTTFQQSVASNHIQYRVWTYQYTTPTYCNGWDEDGNCNSWGGGVAVWDWEYYWTSARINGTAKASVSNVRVQGQRPIVNGDSTTETDSYTIPSGEYYSGAHSNVAGSVTSGNSRSVFINGKSVAVNGSNVRTHANTNTPLTTSGTSSTVHIG